MTNDNGFDQLARSVSHRASRRQVAMTLVAGVFGTLLPVVGRDEAQAETRRKKRHGKDDRGVAPAATCECVGYLKNRGALLGGLCWAKNYATASGYSKSSTPAKGWVMVIQPGTLGTPTASVGPYGSCPKTYGAGHVAYVEYPPSFISPNASWSVRVIHANWWGDSTKFTSYGCSNVSRHTFTVTSAMLKTGAVRFINTLSGK